MNISNTIREQRNNLSLSQEELGEKIYVTRQTISNWETGKSYPDINSLILLSQVFDMTIDNLVKGDIEMMEQKIEQTDIQAMDRYAIVMGIGYVIALILFPTSLFLGSVPGIVLAGLVYAITLYFAYKIEKIKKQYNIQTYREIVAFSKGETLDEITKVRESGKRKYQKLLYAVGAAMIGFLVAQIIWWILGWL